ncbi:hypothetical protein X733_29180 [Mesorhizobium sp. L2C067A000]|nr:hypothetical protein X733_29180 [Mesorhizobium sp. L2C067A000]
MLPRKSGSMAEIGVQNKPLYSAERKMLFSPL